MDWPTWKQGAFAAVVSALAAVATRRAPPRRFSGTVFAAAKEFALVAGLYSVWRVARTLPLAQDEGAIERARDLNDLQRWLHLPSELSLQEFVLRYDWLARLTNYYYAIVHVPALVGFLVWMFVRHRNIYPRWRNGLAIVTGCCLFVRFIRVAPPRFLADLGYIDISTIYGFNVYGPVGTGASDQFAAMPSIHVGWAAVVSFGAFAAIRNRWRWVALLHVVVTMLVVSASGNHWWLDGLVAVALLAAGMLCEAVIRRRFLSPSVAATDGSAEEFAEAR